MKTPNFLWQTPFVTRIFLFFEAVVLRRKIFLLADWSGKTDFVSVRLDKKREGRLVQRFPFSFRELSSFHTPWSFGSLHGMRTHEKCQVLLKLQNMRESLCDRRKNPPSPCKDREGGGGWWRPLSPSAQHPWLAWLECKAIYRFALSSHAGDM